MNIWIVNPYGTLPSEGWREYRSSMLARALAGRGHQVRWWISDIEHRSKCRRAVGIVDPLLPASVSIEVVETRAYRRNISLSRILYERSFGSGFVKLSRAMAPPDLIVLADPSLFFGAPVAAYARQRNIPLVVDILDLWPELFSIMLPRSMRKLGPLLFAPLYRRRDRLIEQAAAVVAVTEDYLTETTRRARPRICDVIYLGVDLKPFPAPNFERSAGNLEVIYAGTLGEAYDMPAVTAAMQMIAEMDKPVRFTVVGDGPWSARMAALSSQFPDRVRYLGRVRAQALPDLYASCHVGLASYSAGSTVSMPVKIFDYMAAGLATIGGIEGEAQDLLNNGAGRVYRPGSGQDLVETILYYSVHSEHLASARRHAFDTAHRFDQSMQHSRFAALIERILDAGR